LNKNKPEILFQRLNEIGKSLERTGKALALIGLGSVGIERARLDEYSDLDFFVIAKDGCKQQLIQDISWLSSVHPVVYHFQNTADGYKALFADEVYCEFAVFEIHELELIPYAEGQVIWKAPEMDEGVFQPKLPFPVPETHSAEWLVGETLTCLYVGLCRYQRGEKLSAFRFVQIFAVDRIVELAAFLEKDIPELLDRFSPERRFEQRFPETARSFAPFMQGYEATPQSALAILEFLELKFNVNPQMKAAILKLGRLCLSKN
jgi:lincosamide nucleotidyltransferase B/F